MVRKLHLRESNEYGYDFLGNAQDRVRDENRVRSVYNLDKRAYELYKLAELNTDIIHSNNPRKAEIGYKAYWDLAQYLRNNNTVQKLDDKYGNYPNVRKAIDVYYAGTYYTEPMDYSRT